MNIFERILVNRQKKLTQIKFIKKAPTMKDKYLNDLVCIDFVHKNEIYFLVLKDVIFHKENQVIDVNEITTYDEDVRILSVNESCLEEKFYHKEFNAIETHKQLMNMEITYV